MISQTEIEQVIGPIEIGPGPESPGQHPKHLQPPHLLDSGDLPTSGRGAKLGLDKMPNEPKTYAERLYRVLHDLDCEGYDWIWIENAPDSPGWAGIRDRLMRAGSSGV